MQTETTTSLPNPQDKLQETNEKNSETQSELMEIIKKQNRLIRFQSTVQSLILLLLIGVTVVAVIFFMRVQTTIDTVDSTLDTVDSKISEINIESLNDSITALNDASAKIEGLDASTINDSVVSLNEAAKTFSKIDTEQINELTESLNNSANAIEDVTDKFKDIFS